VLKVLLGFSVGDGGVLVMAVAFLSWGHTWEDPGSRQGEAACHVKSISLLNLSHKAILPFISHEKNPWDPFSHGFLSPVQGWPQ
jgi:hypothetical protein